MELKFVDVVGFRSEDTKYPAANLIRGGKWICEKKSRNSVNDVTLRLSRVAVINALDLGNYGSSFVSVDVSRMGLHRFESLLPSTELMSARDAQAKMNWTCVHMYSEEHFTSGVRDQKWDLVRITCIQPFVHNEQFGLSFIKVFSFPKTKLPPRPLTPPQPGSAFNKMREQITAKVSPYFINRTEKLLLAAKEKQSSQMIKVGTVKDATVTSCSPRQGAKFRATTEGNDSRNSLEGLLSSPKSPQYTPVKRELKNLFLPRPLKASCSTSEGHILDTTPHRKRVSSRRCLETHKNPSGSSIKSNCEDDRWQPDLDTVILDSDSDVSTVVFPLSPKKCKGSSILDVSPNRLKRDFDSDSETVIVGDMTPKKIGKPMTPMKIKNVFSEKIHPKTKSDFNEPSECLVLEYSELPGPSKVSCPLCSEPFDLSSIEEHAANCESNSELLMACPVCSKYFPPDTLAQHADLCVEING